MIVYQQGAHLVRGAQQPLDGNPALNDKDLPLGVDALTKLAIVEIPVLGQALVAWVIDWDEAARPVQGLDQLLSDVAIASTASTDRIVGEHDLPLS
jgi:hypothetical protein